MRISSIQTNNIPQYSYPHLNFEAKSNVVSIKLHAFAGNVFDVASYNRYINRSFTELKDNILTDFSEKSKRYRLAYWNYLINTCSQNMQEYQLIGQEKRLLNDIDTFNRLKALRKYCSRNLTQDNLRLLDLMLAKSLCNRSKEKHYTDIFTPKARLIEEDNKFIPYIDGEPVTYGEIKNIIGSNTDKEKVEKAKREVYRKGSFLAEDMRRLVKLRNRYANEAGFANYYDYRLEKNCGIKTSEIKKMIDQISAMLENISIPEENTIYPDMNIETIMEIVKNTYKNIGFDIDESIKSGRLTLDFLPRDNKSSVSSCCIVNPNDDVRVITQTNSSAYDAEVLFHELGHAMLALNTNRENWLLGENSFALNEAIAIMMEFLPFKENIIQFDAKTALTKALLKVVLRTEFEIKMYENPTQDLKQLWHDLSVKYKQCDENIKPNNEWATMSLYISQPAYYQNYLRAFVMQAQIYNYLKSNLGNLSENPNTLKFMKENIFMLFQSENENDLIKNITGKELSAEDLINELKN